MVSHLDDAGLTVRVEREGVPVALPAGLDLSVFRIVQEALTNALKHGGAGTIAEVTLVYEPDELRVTVVDDGRGRSNGRADHQQDEPVAAPGHGLVGMRERVTLHGGQFTAGRQRGSGFVVAATFPLSSAYRSAS
jgi:signal transduction histidine kinase